VFELGLPLFFLYSIPMKYLTLIVFLFSCSTARKFPNKNVCFLLYDLKEKKYVTKLNGSHCATQLPAASTFKIPLSLMAYDAGILQDENTKIMWNKEPNIIESWNKDQTAKTWMEYSVVWYSQAITPQLSEKKIESYLKDFDYGNQNFTGGIKTAWLTVNPANQEIRNTLKISGYEQVEFMEKFWKNKLRVVPLAVEMTKKILPKEVNPPHRTMQGKTGSGFFDDEMRYRIGWYVAHLSVGLKEFIVVTNFVDNVEMPQPRNYGGLEAKELTKQLLSEQDLW
jgi:beta-lactamase class D